MFIRRRLFEIWLVFIFFISLTISGYLLMQQSDLKKTNYAKLIATADSLNLTLESKKGTLVGFSDKLVTKSLAELGTVPELSGHVLFFNHVPKCGSEMIVLLLQWLQGYNTFKHVRLKGGKKRQLNRFKQEEIVEEVYDHLKSTALPLSFDRHVYFINFTSFGKQSPIYINLIRDPIDKIISRFHYEQATPNPRNPDILHTPPQQRKVEKTISQCITAGDPECTFVSGQSYDLSIPYFCGHNPRCMILNDLWAFNQAKSNVERYYPVVGILEELNSTLEVFEHTIPFFFKGIQNLYNRELLKPSFNRNKVKPKNVDENTRKYLKESLQLEYEFYEWIRSRLFQKLKIINGHNHK